MTPIEQFDVDKFFDECECYFERPIDGGLEDAIELLSGSDTEVRLAAIAFAKLCIASHVPHEAAEIWLKAAKLAEQVGDVSSDHGKTSTSVIAAECKRRAREAAAPTATQGQPCVHCGRPEHDGEECNISEERLQPGAQAHAQLEWAIKDISERYQHALFCREEACESCNYWRDLIRRGPAPGIEGAMAASSSPDAPGEPQKESE